jgi:hypothetical protein
LCLDPLLWLLPPKSAKSPKSSCRNKSKIFEVPKNCLKKEVKYHNYYNYILVFEIITKLKIWNNEIWPKYSGHSHAFYI